MNTPTPNPRPVAPMAPAFDLNEARTERDRLAADFSDAAQEIARLMRELEFVRAEAKSIYDTSKQIEGERDALREVARSNKRHVAELTAIVESVAALTVSTDGDPIDHDAEIPVGEIVRALNEPVAPAVRPVEPSAVPVEGSGHPQPAPALPWPFEPDPVAEAHLRQTGIDPDVIAAILRDHIRDLTTPPRRPILSLDTPEGATNANP